jgi:FAD-dependent urate hydroxylase
MKTDILIIGAGPYGISLYSELVRLKFNVVVIGMPFSLWMDHMIPQLNLRSNVQASEIYSIDGRYSW